MLISGITIVEALSAFGTENEGELVSSKSPRLLSAVSLLYSTTKVELTAGERPTEPVNTNVIVLLV